MYSSDDTPNRVLYIYINTRAIKSERPAIKRADSYERVVGAARQMKLGKLYLADNATKVRARARRANEVRIIILARVE